MSRPQGPADPRPDLVNLHAGLCTLGAQYDAAPAFPAESLDVLTGVGLHRRYAPLASGGTTFGSARLEALDLLDSLRVVGRADLSLGRLFEGHVNALKLFAWYGALDQTRRLGDHLDRGLYYGVWATEPAPGVRIVGTGDTAIVEGAKAFATGAGGLGFAVITARAEVGPRRMVIVPADTTERTDLSGWQVRGMRATGSGLYEVTGLPASREACLGAPGDYDREPRFTAGAWRFTAVQLGGIEGLLMELRLAMSEGARNDPLQRAKFAEAVVATRTAGFWVREAALRSADEDSDAPAFVQMTRGIVERAGLDVIELAARIVGTRSAFDGQRIDKISRDLSLYLRQAGPDHARDQAAQAWLDHDVWSADDRLW